MTIKLNKKLVFLTINLVTVFLLSRHFFYQKWLGYELIPENNIFDEHDYPYVGYTFRTTGIPIGWSNMNIYKILEDKYKDSSRYPQTSVAEVDIGKGKEQIRLVRPFLDHPPLGSLIFSLNTKSADKFDDFHPAQYRYVALIISVITGILLFVYSYQLYRSLIISYLSLIIYSSATTYVLLSRFALLENLLIPGFLLTQILILASSSPFLLTIAGLATSFSYLCKETSVFIFLPSLFLLINRKSSKRSILAYLIPAIAPIVLYYLYSLFLSPELTIKHLFDQSARGFFGPLSFLYSVFHPRFTNFPLEGYWLWGLISLCCLATTKETIHRPLLVGFFSFLLIFLILGGQNYPWYSLPFMPFFVIASAYFIYQLLTSPKIFHILIFFLLPFSSSFYWGYLVFHQSSVNIYRLLLLSFLAVFLLYRYSKTKLIGARYFWFLFIALVLFQVYQWNLQGFQYVIGHWGKLPENLIITNK